MWNLKEQVKKAFCYQKVFYPFIVWIPAGTKILPRNRNMIKTPDTPTQFEIVGIKFSLYRSNHQGSLWISAYCDDGSIFGQIFQAQNSVLVQIWQIVDFGIFSMFV